MAQGEGFKHITVTAADEEDVVIIAGAKEDAGREQESENPDPMPEPEPEIAPAPEPVPQSEADAEPALAPQPKPKQKDSYHETTLEDLEHTPMPFAQRVVIIAAIICIIGAVIYYVAFMR